MQDLNSRFVLSQMLRIYLSSGECRRVSSLMTSLINFYVSFFIRSKMSRICLIERKLKRIFGSRMTNYTSNLLRYYDLPLSPERLGPPLQSQTYLAHRCSDQQRLLTWQNQLQTTQTDKTKSGYSSGNFPSLFLPNALFSLRLVSSKRQ